MSASRLFRPLARVFPRQPLLLQSVERSALARPAFVAAMSTKPAKPATSQAITQVQLKNSRVKASQASIKPAASQNLAILQSGMPQLLPFFFVNETVFAFIFIPSLIYVLSKYILPQRVRLMAARMFISKL